ncbi:MAG: hypothetical protein PVJ07_02480 [Anaerolineales bacterium]|jgi:hypothetical protein
MCRPRGRTRLAVSILGIGSRLLEHRPRIIPAIVTLVGWVYCQQMD